MSSSQLAKRYDYCISGVPDSYKKNLDKLMTEVKVWIQSDRTYTVRYATWVMNLVVIKMQVLVLCMAGMMILVNNIAV